MYASTIGILVFVPDLYEDYPMSRHHIIRGLSTKWKVLWVSPPLYWQSIFSYQKPLSTRGLRKVTESLWTYAPLLPADYTLHYSNDGLCQTFFRKYSACWDYFFVLKVKSILRAMHVDNLILYIWRPEFARFLSKFKKVLTCYHIVDEYSFNQQFDEPISSEEMAILRQADLVFIHSKTLLNKKGHINSNTYLVPNGVDFEHYQHVLAKNYGKPIDLATIPSPRIGYIGHIKRHIDLELLAHIAAARSDWSIVLIGPIREEHLDIRDEFYNLKRLPNVYFLGGKPAADLPIYINGLDVCLMPYHKTSYTKYIYPLKLHEYLACGKPVVATTLDNLTEFDDVLHFAETKADWIDTIETLIQETGSELKKRRIDVARQNSWENRINFIKTLLDAKLN